MRQRTLIAGALMVALVAILVAGCGGGDDTTSSTTDAGASGATGSAGTELTAEEFLKEGNAICAAGNKEIDSQANQTFSGGQPSQAQIEQFATDTLIPSIQGQIDDIRALTPPADLADQVDTFLTEAESALGEIENDPSLAAANGNDGPFADVNSQAEQIGLTECAG